MAEIRSERVAVTTAGGAGGAVGSTISGAIHGFILDIYLDYHGSAPATTDVTVAFRNRGGNILQVLDNKTDTLYHPRAKPVDNAGAAITNAHDWVGVSDELVVSVAQADALAECVVAYIKYLRSD